MTTPSARNLSLIIPFAALLATILVVGLTLAPRGLHFQAWPAPPGVEDIGRTAPVPDGMPLADVTPRRNPGAQRTPGGMPKRDGGATRRRLVRRESSATRARRSRPSRRHTTAPTRPGQIPAEPDRAPAQTPDPATPPAEAPAAADAPLVAEVPPAESTLRPTEPETPVAPVPTVTVNRDDEEPRAAQSGPGRGRGHGRGHGSRGPDPD